MAFTDPQSVTINAVANSLPRTSVDGSKSTYSSSDGLIQETFSTTAGKQGRKRHLARIDHSKLSPDPFVSSENDLVSMSSYIVIDRPANGYTATEAKQVVDGFIAQLNASSGALITKLLGSES
ncbi:TPA_asm: coat protein [ssRNA phage Gerhypos.4_25]|uniref:Coat protein n=2 Tax=Leviviricetes TaxID=2842243 RepID=A0A8S5KYZ4_9VIRU|nr:coat protein [ssRNA phage Gerhypos.4_25]QDH90067.1 MAG: hypothetical protein H4Bulk46540_000002 [Leviviridae sp.]DAD50528.1 TPA_asm: coat protein [ssRNA phage Gerhypos.4_25]